ncbi:MAG: hypothetical protein WDN23_21240 [Edaphobacter sp.]
MFLISTLALALTAPQAAARPHIPADKLNDIATILAHDEGWPLGNPDYTLDPMTPDTDDGFDSIGVYRSAHLVRMYSVDRTTGQIVDFMRGCQVFRFPDLAHFEQSIRAKSNAVPLTDQQLAKKSGCSKLTVVNTRWVNVQ